MGKLLSFLHLLLAITSVLSQRMVFTALPSNPHLGRHHVQSTLVGDLNDTLRCHKLMLQIQSRPYELCITDYNVTSTGLLGDSAEIVIQNSDHALETSGLVGDVKLSGGYVLGYDGGSFARGYLSDGRFFGKVQVGKEVFRVEPVKFFRELDGKVEDNRDAVIFREHNKQTLDTFSETVDVPPDLDYFTLNINPHFGKYYKVNQKSCSLLVAIDNSFVQVVGEGVVDTALARMILNLDEANAVLRSGDFDDDGVPDDVGVELKTVLILSSKSVEMGSIIETPIDEPINPKTLLKTFTTLEPLKFYCLAILFTGQPFHKRFLGVSFTPSKSVFDRRKLAGICAPWLDLGYSLNSLAITHKLTDGSVMPSSLAELNLAHELAHAFGSDHDGNDCQEGYLMQPKASVPKAASNLEFSNCSKISISIVLRKQGHCLRDNTKSFCGNGIVEEGEECDCGSSTHCLLSDACCIPRSLPRMCTVKDEVECHPSQGICCTPRCKYRDLGHLGLNCTNFNTRCPCMDTSKSCNCGVMGVCMGKECHSYECTRLGLKECQCPKLDDGFCRICCMFKGRCTPASAATREYVKSTDVVLRPNLRFASEKMSVNVTMCNGQGTCFELDFRLFAPNTVCVSFGKVGLCSDSECVTAMGALERSPLFLNHGTRPLTHVNLMVIFLLCMFIT